MWSRAFCIQGVFAALFLSGCASWPYVEVQQEEVTELILGDVVDERERRVLAEYIEANAPEELLAHPQACRRKDCASPEMEFYYETHDATLLLSAIRQLWRANERAWLEHPHAPRTALLRDVTAKRLPALRAEVDDALFVVLAKHDKLPKSTQLQLTVERLQVALLLAGRLERHLAHHHVVVIPPKPSVESEGTGPGT